MTQQFRYVKKAARKLHCRKEKKNDFRRQLASDIASALESGDAIRITDKGLSYTTVQTKVRYTNQTVIFTLSWNDKKQLCGFYLRGDAYE